MNEPSEPNSSHAVDATPATDRPADAVPHLHSGPLLGTVAAILGGLLSWAILMAILPVFVIPVELASLELPVPPDKAVAQDLAIAKANRENTILALAILGIAVGGVLTAVEAWKRGGAGSTLWRCPLAGLVGGAFGVGAGFLGAFLFAWLKGATDLSPLARTIAMQAAMLGTLGLGIGAGMAVSFKGLRLLVQGAVGGALGGLLAALLYPTLVGYLLPGAQTERLLPKDAMGLFCLIAVTTLLIALVVTGLGKKPSAN